METTGEMNWQLLIKMVSSSLGPLPFDSLFGSWKIDWEPEELAARVLLLGGSRLQEDGVAVEEREVVERRGRG